MRFWLRLCVAILGLLTASYAGDQSRSYSFTAEGTKAECAILPQSSFEVLPSLARSKSDDRLTITCKPLQSGQYLLTLNFSLTDAPPALGRGESRSYSFRWGEKIGARSDLSHGEFYNNEERCKTILQFLQRAQTTDSSLGPTWVVGCLPEDRWGIVMEFRLIEASK